MTWGSPKSVMWATLKSHDSLLPLFQRTKNILYTISELICNFLLKLLVSDSFASVDITYQFIIAKLLTPIFKIVVQELTCYLMIICIDIRKFYLSPISSVEDNLLLQAILPFMLNFLQNVMVFQESAYGLHLFLCKLQILSPKEVGILQTVSVSLLCLVWV